MIKKTIFEQQTSEIGVMNVTMNAIGWFKKHMWPPYPIDESSVELKVITIFRPTIITGVPYEYNM